MTKTIEQKLSSTICITMPPPTPLSTNNNNKLSNPATNSNKRQSSSQLVEPNFFNSAIKWNKTVCPPCKGIYTWISSPRAMYNNRKLVKSTPDNGDIIQRRPLFVTTVPTGVYLQPVRELPIPPPKRTYAYYSIPKIFGYNKENNSSEGNVRSPTHSTSKHHTKQMKLRDVQNSQNIMYDKRVIRGSNYGQSNLNNLWNPYFAYAGLLSGKVDTPPVNKDEENRRRRQLLRKRIATRNQRGIIGTPPPVKGRKHEDVQTEKYLEELYSRPPEMDVQCQTDLFLQRPPTPPYVPKKTGVDAVTEILEGELFHFDTEVEPLLKSLVSKSVEQGLMEVMHEEELAEIRKQQQEFLAIRESELAELRRLEAEELRLQTEKERRLKQEAVARAVDLDMNERITAAKLLQGHIANILPDVLRSIDPYKDAENRDALERELGPWLAAEVATEIGQMVDSRDLLEEIVREILEERAEKYLNMTDDTSSSDQFEDYEDSQVEENNSYFHLADDESETKSNL